MSHCWRLVWLELPTLVASPAMKAITIIHPWEGGPLSAGGYLRIQELPDEWRVAVPVQNACRLFGEAAPVQLAGAIARTVHDRIPGAKTS